MTLKSRTSLHSSLKMPNGCWLMNTNMSLKLELVDVCVCYINYEVITERADGLVKTGDMLADEISQRILKVQNATGFGPMGFCCDGASVMFHFQEIKEGWPPFRTDIFRCSSVYTAIINILT